MLRQFTGPKSLTGFKLYATSANKCQHCCGSMQPDETCWAQWCCVLLANNVASFCMGTAGTEQSFKNVRYSTINNENKYKSKHHLFICFQNFRCNFVVCERNVHILFCWHIWAELSLFLWTFLSGTRFPGGGGGGCTCTQCTPPPTCVRACIVEVLFKHPNCLGSILSLTSSINQVTTKSSKILGSDGVKETGPGSLLLVGGCTFKIGLTLEAF